MRKRTISSRPKNDGPNEVYSDDDSKHMFKYIKLYDLVEI